MDNEGFKNGFEQHIQTALVTVVSGLLMWVGITVMQSRTDIARLEEKITGLQATMSFSANDRYQGADAARDLRLRDIEIESLKFRVNKIEKKLETVTNLD